ncbi:MAG TPA: efflux RND transporter periplasmic adaptor subunit [Candidatus Binataceae bacterium]|jgi:RND family efflux transporter MFP subunit|nr:efflux RND transporter periplasmic adaptor subunit [Candidatus Binataceae bacterium]
MEVDPKNYTPKPPGRAFYAGWIVAVVVLLVLTAGLVLARSVRLNHQTSALDAQVALGARVLVAPVGRSERSHNLQLPATVHGFIETPVYAKISGYLKTINVDKGDRVTKGQVVAVLDAFELDHQVASATAVYKLAQVTDLRNQTLRREGVIAAQLADDSHARMVEAEANLKQLAAMQDYKTIRAPFDGVITARYVDPGHLIPQETAPASSNTPVVAISTLAPARVYAEVPQSVAPFIRDGDPAIVTVTEYPGRKFEGNVSRHPQALTSATRTMLVEVDLPNQDLALLPGMYASLELNVNTSASAPTVPDDALIFRDGKPFVPLVRNGRLKLASVTLGYDNGVDVQITDGIAPDDLVALNVGQAARDGDPVRPITAAQTPK